MISNPDLIDTCNTISLDFRIYIFKEHLSKLIMFWYIEEMSIHFKGLK